MRYFVAALINMTVYAGCNKRVQKGEPLSSLQLPLVKRLNSQAQDQWRKVTRATSLLQFLQNLSICSEV